MTAEKQKQFNDSVSKVNATSDAVNKLTQDLQQAQASHNTAMAEHEKLLPTLKTA